MGDLIQMLRMTPAIEVKERWGVTEQRLAEMVKARKLALYTIREITKRPYDDAIIYFCDLPKYTVPRESDLFEVHPGFIDSFYDSYVFEGLYFNTDDVEKNEEENPTLLWKQIPIDSILAGSEEIQIKNIRKELNMSPKCFVDFLNDDSTPNRLITSYEESFQNKVETEGWRGAKRVPFFSIDDLNSESLTVHRLDWEDFQRRGKVDGQGRDIPLPAVEADNSGLESQLAEAQKQIDSLHQWNKRLNEQNQRLRAELAAAQEAQLAVKAEPITTVNASKWGNSVTAAFGVWADIIAGDKADWKEDEFRAAIAERCNDYHTTVHDIAWRTLPDGFKNGRGRPKKNTGKSQHSDNS